VIYELAMTIMTVLNGIVVSFIRATIGLVLVVLNLQVVCKSLTPSWMHNLVQIDLPSLSYISEVYVYHMHFNPITRAYANLLATNVSKTSTTAKKAWLLYMKSKHVE
jgi:hypothetical protein